MNKEEGYIYAPYISITTTAEVSEDFKPMHLIKSRYDAATWKNWTFKMCDEKTYLETKVEEFYYD